MKWKILTLIIFSYINAFAQTEFTKNLNISGFADKVFRTSKSDYLLICRNNKQGATSLYFENLCIILLDSIGNLKWKKDILECKFPSGLQCDIIKNQMVVEVNNNLFEIGITGSYKYTPGPSKTRRYKIDNLGNVLNSDSVLVNYSDYPLTSFNKFNKFFLYTTSYQPYIGLIDSNFNLILDKRVFKDSLLTNQTTNYSNFINEDSSILSFTEKNINYTRIINNNNLQTINEFVLKANLSDTIKETMMVLSPQKSYSVAVKFLNNDSARMVKFTNNGNIFIDKIVTGKFAPQFNWNAEGIIKIQNNDWILMSVKNKIYTYDSVFNLIKSFTIDSATTYNCNDFYLNVADSSLKIVAKNFCEVRPTVTYVSGFLFNKSFYQKVQSISISGKSYINTPNETVQYTTTILPIDAYNKTLFWSVSDTSKASISQNGLLTAKANGNIYVFANATDGSGVKGSLAVTITNQNTGIYKESSAMFNIYPNPATQTFTIESNEVLKVQLFNLEGKDLSYLLVQNGNSFNLNQQLQGIFLLKLSTENGIIFKKIIFER